MALLIDGYNLLHVTGLFGRSFEGSRAALLNFLAAAIESPQREQTTVVFDASEAPPGLPQSYSQAGMSILYARDYDSADALLEELIAGHPTPRKLTVVSSDHRVQRAARKRKATPIDSHTWYGETVAQLHRRRGGRLDLPDIKPDAPLTPGEVEVWLRVFASAATGDDSPAATDRPALESRAAPPPTPRRPRTRSSPPADITAHPPAASPARRPQPRPPRSPRKPRKPPDLGFGSLDNPFPPGYGEDIEP